MRVLLLLILRDVPLDEIIESLRGADANLVLLSLLMAALGLVTRGIQVVDPAGKAHWRG